MRLLLRLKDRTCPSLVQRATSLSEKSKRETQSLSCTLRDDLNQTAAVSSEITKVVVSAVSIWNGDPYRSAMTHRGHEL